MTYVASKLGVDAENVAWKSGFAGDASSHAFVRQQWVSHNNVYRASVALALNAGVPLSSEWRPRRERRRQRRVQQRRQGCRVWLVVREEAEYVKFFD